MDILLHSNLGDVKFYFMTPILNLQWNQADKHNNQLKKLILRQRQDSPGKTISNQGGWQSTDSFLSNSSPAIKTLDAWFEESIKYIYNIYTQGKFQNELDRGEFHLSMKKNGWANINSKGDWNVIHNHAESHWSGVYYVKTNERSGNISFLDPRPAAGMCASGTDILDVFSQTTQEFSPQEGQLFIFPSWLFHMVQPNKSNQDRISIAFNARVSIQK